MTGQAGMRFAERFISGFKPYDLRTSRNSSLRLGSFFGCTVRIHASFMLQLVVTWLIYFHQISGLPGMIRSSSLVLIQFGCILLHELGHLLAAHGLGMKTDETTLYCMGGVSELNTMTHKRWQQIIIAAAGPLVTLVIATALFLVAKTILHQDNLLPDGRIQLLMALASANMLLLFHNLAPAFPFDGGRILQTLLATRLSDTRAIQIPAWFGQSFAILFGLFALIFNPALILNAWGIFTGAQQQAALAKFDILKPERPKLPILLVK
jgi:Zn-dependent protease